MLCKIANQSTYLCEKVIFIGWRVSVWRASFRIYIGEVALNTALGTAPHWDVNGIEMTWSFRVHVGCMHLTRSAISSIDISWNHLPYVSLSFDMIQTAVLGAVFAIGCRRFLIMRANIALRTPSILSAADPSPLIPSFNINYGSVVARRAFYWDRFFRLVTKKKNLNIYSSLLSFELRCEVVYEVFLRGIETNFPQSPTPVFHYSK